MYGMVAADFKTDNWNINAQLRNLKADFDCSK